MLDAKVHRLWAQCLQAEILDYYARYADALGALGDDGRNLARALRRSELFKEKNKRLLRQQLWTVCFYSHCYYRDGRYQKAEELLRLVRRELDSRLPIGKDEPSFGLRARVAYSLGQVYRQMGNVALARREFLSSVEFTRKRLEAKLEKYEEPDFESVRIREQKFANYVTAKIFSFGLTWAANNEGSLQRARGSAGAGFTLFLSTRDEVHTAYAKVMYAQILRSLAPPARATGSVNADLQEALTLLAPLCDPDRSPLRRVPRFLMRARYEYARALLLADRVGDAESVARDLHEKSTPQSRHFINSGVLLLRTLAEANRLSDAVAVSDNLAATADEHLEGAILAEVKISRAELLMRLPEVDFNEVDQCLTEAEGLARENPVSRAVCALHRARWRALQGHLDKAAHELRKWEQMGKAIENGLLRHLAKEVSAEIEGLESVLRITPEDLERGKLDGVTDMVHRWAIGRLHSRFGEDYLKEENVQELLGRGAGAVKGWQRDLNYRPGGKRQRKPPQQT